VITQQDSTETTRKDCASEKAASKYRLWEWVRVPPACFKKGNNMKPFTIEDAEDYIYLDKQGSIVVESVFAKGFKGDLKLLLSCVEEHIVCDKLGNESINWHTARID